MRRRNDHGGHIHPPGEFCGSNCPQSPRYKHPGAQLVSGVDERVETVREALHVLTDLSLGQAVDDACLHESSLNAYAALDSLAASVASLEQRADEAEKALKAAEYLISGYQRIEYGKPVRNFDERIAAWESALAAAAVSAEPTEETT